MCTFSPNDQRNSSQTCTFSDQPATPSQKYLIFAILSCVPDRQRTLRELELGRTLVKDGDKCALRYVTCFLADSSSTDFLTCGERHPDWCRPYFLMRFL